MFMSDKPRNQQLLARDLAELVDVLKSTTAQMNFIAAFWKTMSREWSGIDGLRMDKYLYLVRCYVAKGFEICAKSKAWTAVDGEDKVWKAYVEALQTEGGPLSLEDSKNQVPVGLRLHVLDIWVDELEKVDVKHEVSTEKVMAPVKELAAKTLTKSVRERAKEAVGDERIRKWNGEESEEDDDEEQAEDDGEGMDEDDDFGGFDD
jgi:ribosomal RNA-processing protein 1